MTLFEEPEDWKEVLDRLSAIREQGDYSTENVDYIRSKMQSPDERIRGGAALAAEGCLLEPYVLDQLINLAENDSSNTIRKAAIQSLGGIIYEGVMQDLEEATGQDTDLDYSEEWEELQTESLREDYQRTRDLLFSLLQNEFEDRDVREAALVAVSDLGFREDVRDWIHDFIESERESSRLVALHAMGKFPAFWITELAAHLQPGQSKPILLEAISSSYSSESPELAARIGNLLETADDPDITAEHGQVPQGLDVVGTTGVLSDAHGVEDGGRG